MNDKEFAEKIGISTKTLQRLRKFNEARERVCKYSEKNFEDLLSERWLELKLSQKDIIDLSKLNEDEIRHVS